MTDARYELRLRTCPWCGDEVQEESIPGREDEPIGGRPQTRMWVPWTDYVHHHALEQVLAFGREQRAAALQAEYERAVREEAATQQRRLDGVLRTAVEQQRLERRRQRAARRTPPPPPQVIAEYGDETL